MSTKVRALFTDEQIGESRDKFSFIEEFDGIPSSVMSFKKSKDLMGLLDESSGAMGQVPYTTKAVFSGTPLRYSIYNPDQAVWILKYFTNKDFLILDPFMGRGTRSQISMHLGRKYVGYDTCPDTIKLNEMLSKRNNFSETEYTYINGDGTELIEYKDKKDCFDAVFTCPPYYQTEVYSGTNGDLSTMKDGEFDGRIEYMFKNLFRLIKPSDYDEEKFYPVIFTVGSKRLGKHGLLDMDYSFQEAAKKAGFILHDKLITQNKSSIGAFTFRRNYKKKFLQKSHETTLVFIKYK